MSVHSIRRNLNQTEFLPSRPHGLRKHLQYLLRIIPPDTRIRNTHTIFQPFLSLRRDLLRTYNILAHSLVHPHNLIRATHPHEYDSQP